MLHTIHAKAKGVSERKKNEMSALKFKHFSSQECFFLVILILMEIAIALCVQYRKANKLFNIDKSTHIFLFLGISLTLACQVRSMSANYSLFARQPNSILHFSSFAIGSSGIVAVNKCYVKYFNYAKRITYY